MLPREKNNMADSQDDERASADVELDVSGEDDHPSTYTIRPKFEKK